MALKKKNRALLFLFCILFALSAHATHLQWQGSYELARKRAQAENKNILVFLVYEKNEKTGKMILKNFMNQPYIEKMNTEFIAVIVEKGTRQSYPIELLYTQTYPALFFLSAEELFLCRPLEGVITPSKVSQKLSECN